jgi:hypothetical protein
MTFSYIAFWFVVLNLCHTVMDDHEETPVFDHEETPVLRNICKHFSCREEMLFIGIQMEDQV